MARTAEKISQLGCLPASGRRMSGRLGLPGQVWDMRAFVPVSFIFLANRRSREIWEYNWKSQTFFYQTLATSLTDAWKGFLGRNPVNKLSNQKAPKEPRGPWSLLTFGYHSISIQFLCHLFCVILHVVILHVVCVCVLPCWDMFNVWCLLCLSCQREDVDEFICQDLKASSNSMRGFSYACLVWMYATMF